MASRLSQLISTLISLSLLLAFPVTTTSQECVYPCYPPPTGTTGSNPTPPSTILAPPTQAGFFPPPNSNLPFSPPSIGGSPPPPNEMVPWFPYYFRKPPHQDGDQSSCPHMKRSTVMIILAQLMLPYCFF